MLTRSELIKKLQTMPELPVLIEGENLYITASRAEVEATPEVIMAGEDGKDVQFGPEVIVIG